MVEINLSNLGTYVAVFNAGLLSFFSPCLLPLIPAYISIITGLSLEELTASRRRLKAGPLLKVALFILGFSLVFVLLGAGASYLGSLFQSHRRLLAQIAALFIILLGLNLIGLVRLPFLEGAGRKRLQSPVQLLASFFLGGSFALGWTPCVGPILGSLLLYAAAEKTVAEGMLLLFVYSLGIGIPFFFTAIFLHFFLSFFQKFKGLLGAIKIVSGAFLLLFGFLLLTNKLSWLSSYLLKTLPSLPG